MQSRWSRRRAGRLLLVAVTALLMSSCTTATHDDKPANPSSTVAEPVAGPSPTASGTVDSELPDPGHIRATSAEEVLDALSDFGFECDWKRAPADPGSDESLQSCKEQNAYLWFSPTLPGTGFVDAARGDAKMKGFAYMTGDHWVMVADRATIVQMARAIGGNGGVF